MAPKDTTVSSACDRGALGVLSLLSLRGGERGAVVPIRVRVHFVLLVPYLTWPRSETVFQGLSYINCRHGLREVGNLYSRDFSSCSCPLSCKSTSTTARADYGIVVLSTRRFTAIAAMQMGKGSAGCRRQFVFWRVRGGGSC